MCNPGSNNCHMLDPITIFFVHFSELSSAEQSQVSNGCCGEPWSRLKKQEVCAGAGRTVSESHQSVNNHLSWESSAMMERRRPSYTPEYTPCVLPHMCAHMHDVRAQSQQIFTYEIPESPKQLLTSEKGVSDEKDCEQSGREASVVLKAELLLALRCVPFILSAPV